MADFVGHIDGSSSSGGSDGPSPLTGAALSGGPQRSHSGEALTTHHVESNFHDDETLYHFTAESDMDESISYADSLVREYLLFNGLTSTLHALERERKVDHRAISLRARKIVDQLLEFAHAFDSAGLFELWSFLDKHFFCKVDTSFLPTIQKLFTSLQRYYLIHAITCGQHEKAREFMQTNIENFRGRPEWERWFILPFLEKPQDDPAFEIYFAKDWSDAFSLSLGNFLSAMFARLPLPKMLNFTVEKKMRQAMELELVQLRAQLKERQNQLAALKKQLEQSGQVLRTAPTPMPQTPTTPNSQSAFSTSPSSLAGASSSSSSRTTAATPKSVAMLSRSQEPGSAPRATSSSIPIAGARQLYENETGMWKVEADKPSAIAFSPGLTHPSPHGRLGIGFDRDHLTDRPLPSVTPDHNPLLFVHPSSPDVAAPRRTSTTSPDAMAWSSSSSSSTGGSGDLGSTQTLQDVVPFAIFGEHKSPIRRCKFSNAGHLIASGSSDGTVRVWATPQQATRSDEPRAESSYSAIFCFAEVLSLAWETNNRILLAGTANGIIKLWSMKTSATIADLTDKGQRQSPRIMDLAYCPTQPAFLSSAQSNALARRHSLLYSWDVAQLQVERKFPLPPEVGVNSVCYSPNGKLVFAGCSDGKVLAFDSKNPSAILGWTAHKGRTNAVAMTKDGSTLLTAGSDGFLQLWDISNVSDCHRRARFTWSLPHASTTTTDLCLSPNSKNVAIPTRDNAFSIYSLNSPFPDPILTLHSHVKMVRCLDWHPSDSVIATGSEDRSIHLHQFKA